jgi:hypothetical protein
MSNKHKGKKVRGVLEVTLSQFLLDLQHHHLNHLKRPIPSFKA